MYGKSDKQYYILPWGGNELRLVTSPEFCEWEKGYLDLLGEPFGHDPAPELPKYVALMLTMSGGLITSSILMGGGLSWETAPINNPIINEDKHQPVMPVPAPIEVPTQPNKKENTQLLESKQQNKDNKHGAELTLEWPASPQGAENEESDAIDIENNKPSTVQLKEKTEETLEEPMPGQPNEDSSWPLRLEQQGGGDNFVHR